MQVAGSVAFVVPGRAAFESNAQDGGHGWLGLSNWYGQMGVEWCRSIFNWSDADILAYSMHV